MSISTHVPIRIEVPEHAFAADEPLVAVERGGYVGSLHRGTIALVDAEGNVALAVGGFDQPVFLRSAAKPFQVMPAVLSGGIEKFGITQQEFAVLCASHAAEQRHMDAVQSVLQKIGLDEAALHCGIHPPIHQQTAEERIRAGISPSPVCNNCSGAHTGMLVACRAMGWPIDEYEKPSHPLQRLTLEILGAFAGLPVESIEYGIDNCAVPAFRLPLNRSAMAFARLATGRNVPANLTEAARKVREAMTAYPGMVGGEESFDSNLMEIAAGSLVAKGGAEAFQGIGMGDLGLGMALKISDGNSRAVSPATMRILSFLGVLNEEQRERLDRFAFPQATNHQGEAIGRVVPVFSVGGGA